MDVLLQDSLGRDTGIIELPEFISYQQDSSAFLAMLDTVRECYIYRLNELEDRMSDFYLNIEKRNYIITPADLNLIVCYYIFTGSACEGYIWPEAVQKALRQRPEQVKPVFDYIDSLPDLYRELFLSRFAQYAYIRWADDLHNGYPDDWDLFSDTTAFKREFPELAGALQRHNIAVIVDVESDTHARRKNLRMRLLRDSI